MVFATTFTTALKSIKFHLHIKECGLLGKAHDIKCCAVAPIGDSSLNLI